MIIQNRKHSIVVWNVSPKFEKSPQFSFVFKPLDDLKYSGYFVRGKTGTRVAFEKQDGTYEPNKLAQFYTGAGGERAARGERLDIDSIIGNYVAIKLKSDKNQNTKKVFQQVVAIRVLTNDELVKAKTVEMQVKEVESAILTEKKKVLEQTLGERDITQTPILEHMEDVDGTTSF